ncbi:MAG: hypothetical protein ACRD43_11235, partial [Pyrinomonadaceae bacterium]
MFIVFTAFIRVHGVHSCSFLFKAAGSRDMLRDDAIPGGSLLEGAIRAISLLSMKIIPLSIPTPFYVGDVNVYLIKEDPITLIDVGPKTPEASGVLRDKLAR